MKCEMLNLCDTKAGDIGLRDTELRDASLRDAELARH